MEMMLVVALIGILGGVCVPAYLGYLEKARVARSIAEIRHIEKSLKLFYVNEDKYPLSLAQLGADNIRDPWGTPYQYRNVMILAAVVPLARSVEAQPENPGTWSWFAPPSAYATPPPDRGSGNGGNAGNRGRGKQGGGSETGSRVDNAGDNSLPAAAAGSRKDRFGASLNSDFDLYSMGRNQETADSLSAPQSHDDIVRASDGMFVGLASDF
jgi:general secretion pathway protein G